MAKKICGNYNFLIEAGAEFNRTITWKTKASGADLSTATPVDLTNYSVRGRISSSYSPPVSANQLVSLTVVKDTPETDGKILISLTSAQTAALQSYVDSTLINGKPRKDTQPLGVWEVEIYETSGGEVVKKFRGEVHLILEIVV